MKWYPTWLRSIAWCTGSGTGREADSRLAIDSRSYSFASTRATAFAAAGVTVLRCDLPFRQERPNGPPFPAMAARDREGLRKAIHAIRHRASDRIFLGGHSYGGRQATIAASEDHELAHGLLLLSYPLHPPRKPQQLRTEHFPRLRTPALFVHGSRDPFGSLEEMGIALALIPGRVRLLEVDGGSHDLAGRRRGSAEARSLSIIEELGQLIS